MVSAFLVICAANIPLGYLRRQHTRFSYGWYFYTLLTAPVVLYLAIRGCHQVACAAPLLGATFLGQAVAALPCVRRVGTAGPV